jgi:hypothetical protein
MTKNWKKFTVGICKSIFDQKLQFTPYMKPRLQEKPSPLKREHPALQNMKILYFFYFCGSFLPFWIRIQRVKLMTTTTTTTTSTSTTLLVISYFPLWQKVPERVRGLRGAERPAEAGQVRQGRPGPLQLCSRAGAGRTFLPSGSQTLCSDGSRDS